VERYKRRGIFDGSCGASILRGLAALQTVLGRSGILQAYPFASFFTYSDKSNSDWSTSSLEEQA
jgi:hypothetical protein